MNGIASRGTWVTATHRYGFRYGEWAIIRGLTTLSVERPESGGAEDRLVYLVEFPDGVCDFWPVDDPWDPYEFADSPPG